jgi:hypothetical protein
MSTHGFTHEKSHGAVAAATAVTVSDFSNPGDTGRTAPLESARPPNGGAAAADGKAGSAEGDLPLAYPLTARPEIAEAIRAQGFEPQQIWDRLLDKHRRSIAKGKGGVVIKDDLGQYLVGIAKDEAKKRREKEVIPGALADARAAMSGRAWKPNGRHPYRKH